MADPWADFRVQQTQASGATAPNADPWSAFKKPQAPEPNVAADVAKSAGSGLIEGGLGLAAAGPLAIDAIARGVEHLANTYGPDSIARWLNEGRAQAEENRKKIRELTGPKFYEHTPETTAGEYAKSTAEFVPAAIAGPGGIVRKTIAGAILPGAGSEAAGQATKGTAFEAPARAAAAITGSVLGRGGGARAAEAPSAEAIKNAASNAYKEVDRLGVEIHPEAVKSIADSIEQTLQKGGISAEKAPKVFADIERMRQPAPEGAYATVGNFDTIRQSFGHAAQDFNNPTEQLAATRAIKILDDSLPKIPESHILRGDAAEGQRLLEEARGNYAAAKRSEAVTDTERAADLNAAAANSGKNIGNATRQRFKSTLLNEEKRQGFSPEELAQMEKIVRGTVTGNALRHASNVLGGGGGLGQIIAGGLGAAGGASLGGAEGGTGGAILLPLLGTLARNRANASVLRQVNKLDEMVRARSPLAQVLANPTPSTMIPSNRLAQALIATRQSENQ